MKQTSSKTTLTLKTLNKSNVWDVQENDIFRMWDGAEKDADIRDNVHHYMDIVKSAFNMEEITVDKPEVVKKYEERGYKIGQIRAEEPPRKWALKKKPILRVTDLTYDNIRHISASKLIEVLERNFGGCWESLSRSVQDIIESGFDVSTTTLPKDRLKKPGGLYEKKVADGFEVLEIVKGTWIEAIFVKEKPMVEMPHVKLDKSEGKDMMFGSDSDDEELPEIEDHYADIDEDDDEFDDDKLTEESYRTTFDTDPEDLDLAAEDVVEEDDY